MFYIPNSVLESIIAEDIPWNDATTEALSISARPGAISCFPKIDGVVSGIDIAKRMFESVGLNVTHFAKDGAFYAAKTPVLKAVGRADQIHAVYKTAQNIMEYSSGISNRVRQMVEQAASVNPKVKIAVTRKHFPGTKAISLNAALLGGAIVHRAGLSESILVFDQHRVFCTDPADAIKAAKLHEPEKKIAVEVSSAEEGLRFIEAGADIIQCERFSFDDLRSFVTAAKAMRPDIIINAAGGVNASNAKEFAAAGADVLVTSWVYFGKPFDIKMKISAP